MPSEYQKWLARDVKPEEKRELTKEEKRKNWWDYHKNHVLIGVLAVALVAWFVYDTWIDVPPKPDFQIAYLGSESLPQDAVDALESALEAKIEDINGDGQIVVQVNQYLVDADEKDYATIMASQTRLTADFQECASFVFLMENPEDMQKRYEFMAYPDGREPAEDEMLSPELWLQWESCPALTGMLEAEAQKPFQKLFLARRIVDRPEQCAHLDVYTAIWEMLIR